MQTPNGEPIDSKLPLTVVVVGASGDLARRKIFPALFSLFCQGYLPAKLRIFGYARSSYSDAEFRARVEEKLTCRYTPDHDCPRYMKHFLERCHYVAGGYDSADGFLDLFAAMREHEAGPANRLYYLAIPPSAFLDVARSLGDAGLVECGSGEPWSRVVIEKPFGRDRASSDELTRRMAHVFVEDQTYRIDHYLGKEVIQNLMVLRFANTVFEPIWNRHFIQSVRIAWKETLGVEGRGGYFDEYGIIRDVVQNHLMQIVALTAMDEPERLDAHHIRDGKVRLLREVRPLTPADLALGQYTGIERAGIVVPGYREDPTVKPESRTPTYACTTLNIANRRWQGVPFFVSAGKALDASMTEVRILFRAQADNLFCQTGACPLPNELVIRVQPDESIALRITSKVPGAGLSFQPVSLDLRYKSAFDVTIPDAYESLILDVVRGEKGLFIRKDELEAAWDIFTPALHALDAGSAVPEPYAFGSKGPEGARRMASAAGWELP